jgi:7-carboxy-7-deazaguanine synthase
MERITAERKSCEILLETGGHRSLENIPKNVHIVMDIKLPGSGEESSVLKSNFSFLKKTDEIKFVITDRNDFESAVKWIHDYGLNEICQVLFSPVYGKLDAAELADWILQDKLNVRLMLQLHKIIWGEKRGV